VLITDFNFRLRPIWHCPLFFRLGSHYTPSLIDNEIIVVVQNTPVTAHLSAGVAGKTAFPIPP